MKQAGYIVAIDQGTTSSRAVAFDQEFNPIASAQQEFTQYFPADGWVEHDAEEIWQSVVGVLSDLEKNSVLSGQTALCVGITNQRETTVLWDRETGEPLHRAIVWQDRRTAGYCEDIKDHEQEVTRKTGLLLDPYFSATKIKWILDHNPNLRGRAENGEVCFGTIECYLHFRLTGGERHLSDATNASRTMLMNIQASEWDCELLQLFDIPKEMLPDIVDTAGDFGQIASDLPFSGSKVTGMIGDQQAAAVGQGVIEPGSMKSTYGTGCFLIANSGKDLIFSKHRLLSTIAYQLNSETHYAIEGSIFNAGTVVQWFRDQLGIIDKASESEMLATSVPDTNGVTFVPAFTGLGAPYWDPDVRGVILGITRATTKAHIVRAGLEAIGNQTADLFEAFEQDLDIKLSTIRIDGGMAANNWFAQYLADICGVDIERPFVLEATAQGAAIMAAIGAKLYPDLFMALEHHKIESKKHMEIACNLREEQLYSWRNLVKKIQQI